MDGGLIAFGDARARLLALARPLDSETVALAAAAGRVLAAPFVACHDQPPADVSAMDGYALAREGWPGPWRIVGEAAAGGALPPALAAGEAARIFTGARVPAGADAVLIQERATVADGWLRATFADVPPLSANIRARALDFAAGQAGGRVGVSIGPGTLGLAAAMGAGALSVHRRPRVAILSTGDELVPPGTAPAPGQIVESISPMLVAMLAGIADARALGIARDREDEIAARLADARDADILVTVGGASVGDHDRVRPALARAGGAVEFWRVAIRPGKPMMAGTLGQAVVLGLPGNPASAFVTALLFLLPLARAIGGWAEPVPPLVTARAGAPVRAGDARRDHLRATLDTRDGELWATPIARQDSSLVSVLAAADALIVRPVGASTVEQGDHVEVLDTRIGRF